MLADWTVFFNRVFSEPHIIDEEKNMHFRCFVIGSLVNVMWHVELKITINI